MQLMRKSHALSPAPSQLPWQLLARISDKHTAKLTRASILILHCRPIPYPSYHYSSDLYTVLLAALHMLETALRVPATRLGMLTPPLPTLALLRARLQAPALARPQRALRGKVLAMLVMATALRTALLARALLWT